jgi:serine/threonine-protein kinase
MAVADRYNLTQPPLGAGTFGRVYHAIDRTTGGVVALKVLLKQDFDSRERFYREAVALHGQFANEHVVTLIDYVGLNDPLEPHIASEFCELGSLRRWVGAGRSLKDVVTAMLHAAKGLAGVHAAGGLHRDLKPDNIMVARAQTSLGWIVKLGDFGLAGFPHPVTGTMTYTAFGTKGYIAPELYGGAWFHRGADVYALGVTAIELVVGRNDFGALAMTAIPTALKALLQSMVSGVPEKRPTAAHVVLQLEAVLASPPFVQAPSPPKPPPSAGETLAKGAVGVGLAALAIAALNAIFGGGGTYYDAEVDRNRGPDGRFRPS